MGQELEKLVSFSQQQPITLVTTTVAGVFAFYRQFRSQLAANPNKSRLLRDYTGSPPIRRRHEAQQRESPRQPQPTGTFPPFLCVSRPYVYECRRFSAKSMTLRFASIHAVSPVKFWITFPVVTFQTKALRLVSSTSDA